MARKNRIRVPDGIYHVTTRVAYGVMLFRDDGIKERILAIMYKVAAFSGIELYDWCIIDNHIHMLVHVPKVPGCYLDDPEVEPAAYAFGMRPAERRVHGARKCTKSEASIGAGASHYGLRPPARGGYFAVHEKT